jgi:hypothetical protein
VAVGLREATGDWRFTDSAVLSDPSSSFLIDRQPPEARQGEKRFLMIIDCASCVGRPTECGDCVVTVVLGQHPGGLDLDAEERMAMAALAGGGLVPPLRLMPLSVVEHSSTGKSAGDDAGARGGRRAG